MTADFAHATLAGRTVFGAGSRHGVAAAVDTLGATRALVIASRDEDAIALLEATVESAENVRNADLG